MAIPVFIMHMTPMKVPETLAAELSQNATKTRHKEVRNSLKNTFLLKLCFNYCQLQYDKLTFVTRSDF